MDVLEVKRAAKREMWKQIVLECQQSGQPVKHWCKEHGIATSTFYTQQKLLLEEIPSPSNNMASAATALEVPFVEVKQPMLSSEAESSEKITITVSASDFEIRLVGATAVSAWEKVKRVLYNA